MTVKKPINSYAIRIGRREFLKFAGGGAAGVFLLSQPFIPGGRQTRAQILPVTKFTDQLPVPQPIDLTGGGNYSIGMANGMHRFHSAMPETPTWGYGGAPYLGPVLEAKRGNELLLTANNNLGAHPLAFAVDTEIHGAVEEDKTTPRASLHLHGGNTEPDSDGGPEQTFLPGNSRTYHYHNDQEACSLWYHDHALGITRLNVYAGLAGLYYLRDDRDTGRPGNPIGLPTGAYEIPLVIQDKMFNEDGTLAYTEGPLQIWSPEFFGDVAVVNGTVFPNLDVDRGLYRFRVYNGSNARVYNLFFSNNHMMHQIGGDGGLLDAPVALNRLILAPGERADLLVNFSGFSPGTRLVLKNSAPVPYPDGPRSVKRGAEPLPEIMQFTVGPNTGFTGPIPTTLRPTPIPRLTNPVRVRNLTLVELMDMETEEPLMALLNNLGWETTDIEQPVVDTVEQWNIINTTGDTHPIHLHLVQFQILERQKFDVARYMMAHYPLLPDDGHDMNGPWPAPSAEGFKIGRAKRPAANEMGWKDTVRANPGEITRIMVPFGANAAPGVPFGRSFIGEYVWHCHILEHEDNEMMLPYRVVEAPA